MTGRSRVHGWKVTVVSPRRERQYATTDEHILEAKRMALVTQEYIDDDKDDTTEEQLMVIVQLGILHAVTAVADVMVRFADIVEEERK
jgi:hypothetical protein